MRQRFYPTDMRSKGGLSCPTGAKFLADPTRGNVECPSTTLGPAFSLIAAGPLRVSRSPSWGGGESPGRCLGDFDNALNA